MIGVAGLKVTARTDSKVAIYKLLQFFMML